MMKTKVITITDKKKLRQGDLVTLRRTYNNTGAVVTVEGIVQGVVPATMYVYVSDSMTWTLGATLMLDRAETEVCTQEFVKAVRVIEVPPLPQTAGTIAWIEAFSAELRTLSLHHGGGLRWHGVNGFIDTSTITRWQPLTPDTIESPDPDAWIEA